MECRVVFDLLTAGYQYLEVVQLGVVATLSGLLIWCFVYRNKPGGFWYTIFVKGSPLGFSAAWLYFVLVEGGGSYLSYLNLANAYRAGLSSQVEGPVIEVFSPAPGQRRDKVSFRIGDKLLAYPLRGFEPGFRPSDRDNPVREGAILRVRYIDDSIVRLEMCRRDTP